MKSQNPVNPQDSSLIVADTKPTPDIGHLPFECRDTHFEGGVQMLTIVDARGFVIGRFPHKQARAMVKACNTASKLAVAMERLLGLIDSEYLIAASDGSGRIGHAVQEARHALR